MFVHVLVCACIAAAVYGFQFQTGRRLPVKLSMAGNRLPFIAGM